MKAFFVILTAFLFVLALSLALTGCSNPANPAFKINTPAVQAQIIGDAEKDLLAGGGALLISGGSTGAAVAAITTQEIQNIPALQKVLAAQPTAVPQTPATVTP